ncbi:nickel pincer cofactor biosynthesis protein LarB [Devosia nitrariae]|uniref:1-(5-phosphoribosyl)-5-amino-4-imidazole-carboxyl ate carboxylase n=1 Tax=Devosia nitrariae TaxID=2071872 RepID=A0ABQ5W8L5_9HYPH|nr:nickel pincer cofactor biosynthesis protein LarB [Devosia nitrariae]GLQ56164.1 1-(5-phosphoribosyl)-5-amino-4-imidazole-carboxyl ate carboxylase [Devosia nitrariae]
MIAEFQLDWQRTKRTSFPEAVFCSGKSVAQIEAIVQSATERQMPLLLTRLTQEVFSRLSPEVQSVLARSDRSQTASSSVPPTTLQSGIGIVTAGTSDTPIAYEAAATLEFMGYAAPIVADVGVAGLWRLVSRLEEIRQFRVVIAAAGMEGALFSVLAGLIAAPVIAVPTSIGYGVSANGHAALSSALATCAPGVVVVNIDNGFGAAAAAIKMMRICQHS